MGRYLMEGCIMGMHIMGKVHYGEALHGKGAL